MCREEKLVNFIPHLNTDVCNISSNAIEEELNFFVKKAQKFARFEEISCLPQNPTARSSHHLADVEKKIILRTFLILAAAVSHMK